MTSALQVIGILLLTSLPIVECQDGTPMLSVGGVLVMIVFTCCLCMCYRRMYEHRLAMAEAARAPRAVIITCQSGRAPTGVPTPGAHLANTTYTGDVHLPYSPSPHFNPYVPRDVTDVTLSPYDFSPTMHPPPPATFNPLPYSQVQPPPPSYESLFPPQNNQTNSGNHSQSVVGSDVHK